MASRGDGESKSGCGWSALAILGGMLIGGICVIGIVAAIAIPAFITFVKRSKTAEATMQLDSMFHSASNYYLMEHAQHLRALRELGREQRSHA